MHQRQESSSSSSSSLMLPEASDLPLPCNNTGVAPSARSISAASSWQWIAASSASQLSRGAPEDWGAEAKCWSLLHQQPSCSASELGGEVQCEPRRKSSTRRTSRGQSRDDVRPRSTWGFLDRKICHWVSRARPREQSWFFALLSPLPVARSLLQRKLFLRVDFLFPAWAVCFTNKNIRHLLFVIKSAQEPRGPSFAQTRSKKYVLCGWNTPKMPGLFLLHL